MHVPPSPASTLAAADGAAAVGAASRRDGTSAAGFVLLQACLWPPCFQCTFWHAAEQYTVLWHRAQRCNPVLAHPSLAHLGLFPRWAMRGEQGRRMEGCMACGERPTCIPRWCMVVTRECCAAHLPSYSHNLGASKCQHAQAQQSDDWRRARTRERSIGRGVWL
jgi:hypothetical protein